MKRLTIVFFLFLWGMAATWAQEKGHWQQPCGTPPGKTAWFKKYQANPAALQRNTDTLLYVPITVHITGTDAGTGYWRVNRLLDAFCKLNQDFEEANLYFYLAGDINYIDSSAWHSHETVLEGGEMMFANNVENTINTYFVSNPAGNCGYNLPYAGIAMDVGCSGPTDDTWAHEIGHNLSVQHPFLGWEGGVSYDGSVEHNYSDPAPTTVTYNYTFFKDTLILDTLIIDTALVELVDGSNCHEAADGFCDTAPDYLSFRWFCNGDGESPQVQTDPNGETFRSDGSLIMCYSDDPCQSRFTTEQIAAMRANLYDEKPGHLENQTPGPVLGTDPLALVTPINGEPAQFDAVFLEWEPVDNAVGYIVQVSPLASFNALTDEYVVSETSLALPEALINNRTYYWRVRPFNNYTFCTAMTEAQTFETAQLSSVNTIAAIQQAAVFPNPQQRGLDWLLQLESTTSLDGELIVRTLAGQVISVNPVQLQVGRNQLNVPTVELPAGWYTLELRTAQGRLVERVVVQ